MQSAYRHLAFEKLSLQVCLCIHLFIQRRTAFSGNIVFVFISDKLDSVYVFAQLLCVDLTEEPGGR